MTATKNQRFVAPSDWTVDAIETHPAYRPLTALLPIAQQPLFPGLIELNQWRALLRPELPVSFVDSVVLEADSRYYEVYIAETAAIPTRAYNWHDLFGAASWLLYPQTKAALNRRHLAEIASFGVKNRSPLRHQLTLFDECGLILLYRPEQQWLIDLLRQHGWTAAFFEHAALWSDLTPLVFGHALWEMLTKPFIGLTAKLWPVAVDSAFANLSLQQQVDFVDTALSKKIEDFSLTDFRQMLSPIPLLGIPGWYPKQDLAFYQQTDYFRPRRDPMSQGNLHDRNPEST